MTQQTAVVDAETFTVRRTVRINATPARVWAALTRPELITQWLGNTAALPELRVGGEGSFGFDGYGQVPVRIDEYDEPTVFAFTWGTPPALPDGSVNPIRSDNSTQVRYTLAPDGESTVLTVVESGFGLLSRDSAEAMNSNRDGWNEELDELVAYLESSQ
jgi:uncharacterized protein YndB with AHSA1/START domain